MATGLTKEELQEKLTGIAKGVDSNRARDRECGILFYEMGAERIQLAENLKRLEKEKALLEILIDECTEIAEGSL